MYCELKAAEGWALYCDTMRNQGSTRDKHATGACRRAGTGLSAGGRWAAQVRGRAGAGRHKRERGSRRTLHDGDVQGLARRSRRSRHDAGRAVMGAAWACLCAGWACWLGQLGQFGCLVHLTHFDSVFGINTVPELIFGQCS